MDAETNPDPPAATVGRALVRKVGTSPQDPKRRYHTRSEGIGTAGALKFDP